MYIYIHLYIYIYTPPPGLGLEKIRKWLVYTISWCICKLLQNTTLSIYTTTGARSAPVVVYIQTAVFWSSLHIHQEMVYTSHFLIFSRPKPGGGEKKKFSESGLPGGQNLSGPCGSILRYTRASQRPYKAKSEK